MVKKQEEAKEEVKKEVYSDKQKTLDETVSEIKHRFGEGAIMKMGEAKFADVQVISTGVLSLDLALGVGGVPRGRVIEIYGPESSGKSTLALTIVAQAQKKGGLCAFVDAEHALDPEYAKRIGVNLSDLLISQPDTGEQALEIVETLVRSGSIDVVVIDSVAALTPRAEIEGEMGEHHIGSQARLMSHALRKLAAITSKTNTCVIFLNQTRMKIGIMFGNPETTAGGMALKFYASVRIDLRRLAQIKRGEVIVGNLVRAKIVKNKVAAPFRLAEFDILYNEGFSYWNDVLATGVKFGVLKKAGSWYVYGTVKIGQGVDGGRKFLQENPKVTKEIVEETKKAALPVLFPQTT